MIIDENQVFNWSLNLIWYTYYYLLIYCYLIIYLYLVPVLLTEVVLSQSDADTDDLSD